MLNKISQKERTDRLDAIAKSVGANAQGLAIMQVTIDVAVAKLENDIADTEAYKKGYLFYEN